ncbi:RNA polymerase sigma factor [Leptolyngbya sp. 15MV]|nr:RNA polymerase sigma factor [Leptolyngbya sp. 15MV]
MAGGDAWDEAARNRALVGVLADLRAYARGLVGTREAADDLVQDTMVRALKVGAQLPPPGELRPWLFVVLRHRWLDTHRRRHRERRAIGEIAAQPPPVEPAPPPDLARLAVAIAALPATQREALLLTATANFSPAQAAAIVNVPEGTLRARASRARAALRRALGQDRPGAD